jgi:hypothetical protein
MAPGLPGPGRDPGPAGRTAGPGLFGCETRDRARRFTWATRPARPAHERARRYTPYRECRALRNAVLAAKQMNGPAPASSDPVRLHWPMTTSNLANRVTASSPARLTRRAPLSRTASISGARSRMCAHPPHVVNERQPGRLLSPLRNGLSVPTARLIRRGLPAVRIRRCRTADEPERAPGGLLSHRRSRLIAIREDSLMTGIQPHGGPRLTCPPGSNCGTSSCSAARSADARLRRHHGDPLARSAATSALSAALS